MAFSTGTGQGYADGSYVYLYGAEGRINDCFPAREMRQSVTGRRPQVAFPHSAS